MSIADMPAMEFHPAEQIKMDDQHLEVTAEEPSFHAGPAIVASGAAAIFRCSGLTPHRNRAWPTLSYRPPN